MGEVELVLSVLIGYAKRAEGQCLMNEDEIERLKQKMIEGNRWVADKPNILAPEHLAKVEHATQRGIVFGLHCHYKGGGSPSRWAALDFQQFNQYIARSRPGDLYFVWSAQDLLDKGLALAHARYPPEAPSGVLIFSADVLEGVKSYLSHEYNEFIAVYIDWTARTAECDFGDIDSYDELREKVTRYSRRDCEAYVFPLTPIDKPEHYLVEAKYPNEKGEVPIGGAY